MGPPLPHCCPISAILSAFLVPSHCPAASPKLNSQTVNGPENTLATCSPRVSGIRIRHGSCLGVSLAHRWLASNAATESLTPLPALGLGCRGSRTALGACLQAGPHEGLPVCWALEVLRQRLEGLAVDGGGGPRWGVGWYPGEGVLEVNNKKDWYEAAREATDERWRKTTRIIQQKDDTKILKTITQKEAKGNEKGIGIPKNLTQ